MSIEDVLRGIVREELESMKNELFKAFTITLTEKTEELKESEPSKPKRKRKTKAEKEAEEMEAIEKEMEPDEHQQISDEIDEDLAKEEEGEDEAVMEAHDLLREVKALVAASDKENAKDLAKGTLSKFKVDKFTDVAEEDRPACLERVRRAVS